MGGSENPERRRFFRRSQPPIYRAIAYTYIHYRHQPTWDNLHAGMTFNTANAASLPTFKQAPYNPTLLHYLLPTDALCPLEHLPSTLKHAHILLNKSETLP
jgi:hypothetical protein